MPSCPAPQKVRDIIAEWIRAGKCPPGHYLPAERELAEELRTSRVSIREALKTLEQEQIIRREKNCRPVVLASPSLLPAAPTSIPSSCSDITEAATGGIIGLYSPVSLSTIMREGNADLSNMLCAMTLHLEEHGYRVAYMNTYGIDLADPFIWERFVPASLRALIVHPFHAELTPSLRTRLEQSFVPAIVVEGYTRESTGLLNTVSLDHAAGGRLAVDYLRSMGHARIFHLTYRRDATWAWQRRQAFEFCCRGDGEGDVAGRVLCVEGTPDDPGDCSTALDEIRRQGGTAVIAANDRLAAALLQAADRAGLSLPQALSVIGFDDVQLAEDLRLTTVSHMSRELGEMTAEVLASLLENPMPGLVYQKKIRPGLVVRDSVCNIGKR